MPTSTPSADYADPTPAARPSKISGPKVRTAPPPSVPRHSRPVPIVRLRAAGRGLRGVLLLPERPEDAELAVTGIRLVIEEFRSDDTKTLKDGRRGKLQIAYGDPHKPQDAVAWTWKFIDGARTAGDLYGRAWS